jgi:hypothetical protein
MAIHVKDIKKIMDITWKVRQSGKRTIPCLSGPSGIGKSQGVHQWVADMQKQIPGFRQIDLRGATIDASDTRGLPWKDEKTGQTVFLPPDFLPTSGSGVLFIDEINRSPTPVMNCFMELFTEWRIGNYALPKGWCIATAINPADSEAYDVNTMDAALANRVMRYDVKFDHKSFVAYAKASSWSESVINYLSSGEWIYKEPGAAGDNHYISPRSWEEISDLEIAGAKEDVDLHNDICIAGLGKNIGTSYWAFCHKTKPILYNDLSKEYDKLGKKKDKIKNMSSMKDFAAYADSHKSGGARGDLISSTVQSFIDATSKGVDKVDPDLLEAVCTILPADQSAALIQNIAMKTPDPAAWIQAYKTKYKDLFDRLRTSVTKDGVKTATK